MTCGSLLGLQKQQEWLLDLNIVREQAVTQACVHVPRLTLHPRAQVECQRQTVNGPRERGLASKSPCSLALMWRTLHLIVRGLEGMSG